MEISEEIKELIKEDNPEISKEEKEFIFSKYTTHFSDWLSGRFNIQYELPSPS